jgi:hypothetical protein
MIGKKGGAKRDENEDLDRKDAGKAKAGRCEKEPKEERGESEGRQGKGEKK